MKDLRKVVRKMDPKLSEQDESFNAALVLVGAAEVGTNADKIAERTGLARKVVRGYTKRLREQGVFKGDKIACEWHDKEHGGVAFWLDVCVARGLMNRTA